MYYPRIVCLLPLETDGIAPEFNSDMQMNVENAKYIEHSCECNDGLSLINVNSCNFYY